jgi:hypothetical protein
MNAKTVRMSAILTSAMLFLYAGCGVLNLLLGFLINNTTISLPAKVLLCLALILPTVVLLIFGIKQAKKKQGVFDLIASVATLLIGIVWAVFAVLSWLLTTARMFIIEYYYRLDIAMSLDKLLALFNYINIAYTLLTTIVALYLLGIYLISVLRAKKKWLQIKAELHKPAVAALILVPNLISLIQTLLNPIFIRMGTDMLIKFARISMYATFGINMALTLALAVFVLVFGLIIKKQPATKVQEPKPAFEQGQPADLPVNVPAGVNADDL